MKNFMQSSAIPREGFSGASNTSSGSSSRYVTPTSTVSEIAVGEDLPTQEHQKWKLSVEILLGLCALLAGMAITSFVAVPGGFISATSNSSPTFHVFGTVDGKHYDFTVTSTPSFGGAQSGTVGSSVLIHHRRGLANIYIFYTFTLINLAIVFWFFIAIAKGCGGYKFSVASTMLILFAALLECAAIWILALIVLSLHEVWMWIGGVLFCSAAVTLVCIFGPLIYKTTPTEEF